MLSFFALIGGLLAAAGTVPYILETLQGKTKPRIVTWLTWALLTGLTGAASVSAGDVMSGVFAFLGTLATGSVVVIGLRRGDRQFAKLDLTCMAVAIMGLVLWRTMHNPSLAVWTTVLIDGVGFVPTLFHAWRAPHEETAGTYLMGGIGAAITSAAIVASGSMRVTALGYPVYVALSMGGCGVLVLLRRKQLVLAPVAEVATEMVSDKITGVVGKTTQD